MLITHWFRIISTSYIISVWKIGDYVGQFSGLISLLLSSELMASRLDCVSRLTIGYREQWYFHISAEMIFPNIPQQGAQLTKKLNTL